MQTKQKHDWVKLIIQQQQSNLNMKAFCRERNLSYHNFKNHKFDAYK